jgi:hypothetical protein
LNPAFAGAAKRQWLSSCTNRLFDVSLEQKSTLLSSAIWNLGGSGSSEVQQLTHNRTVKDLNPATAGTTKRQW